MKTIFCDISEFLTPLNFSDLNWYDGPSIILSLIINAASFTVSVANSAFGGANAESIPSIKFNAPKSFQRQNRAVIKNDYARTILAEAPDIEAVSVWGGEDNDPPIYGKVYIAAKPTSKSRLMLSLTNGEALPG